MEKFRARPLRRGGGGGSVNSSTENVTVTYENVFVSSVAVTEILKRTDNRTAPGPDNVNYKILQILNKTFPDLLSELLQGCPRYGTFPEVWKIGKVIWLLKDAKDPKTLEAYRPITLLSKIGKLLEKTIALERNTHIEENELLSKNQYGFR